MNEEEWRHVPGYPLYVTVSNKGRVKLKRRVIKTVRGPRSMPEKMLKQQTSRKGYKRVTIEYKGVSVHRLVCKAFNSIPDNHKDLMVMHLNDNPGDNRPENLWWGTAKDNQQDAVRKGRQSMIRKTHCPKGHAYDGENTYIRPNGHRKCQECHREFARNMAKKGLKPGDFRHGTTNGYNNYKCRCEPCKIAKKERGGK